jgi:hypothetical protein
MLTAASTVAGVLRPARARAFLITVASRDDYPRHLGYLLQGATDEQVVTLAREVLKVRRATEYAPLVITECSAAELPPTVAGLMLDINAYLTAARKLAALAAVMDLDDTRLAILDADGQLLIQGGPGSGKTTIALLKAARTLERLEPEQQVVFLSFSRAAVRQIATASPSTFPAPCVTARRSARSTRSS